MSTEGATNTNGYEAELPALGLITSRNLSWERLGDHVRKYKRGAIKRLHAGETRIERSLGLFETFFSSVGATYPLRPQLERAKRKGLPNVNPFVDLLLAAESSTGILMGVQDLSKCEGALTFNRALVGESYIGMRGKPIVCESGEPVVRDATGIIASYFQGPDRKTMITTGTRNVVFFVFGVHGLGDDFSVALSEVSSVLSAVSVKTESTVIKGEMG